MREAGPIKREPGQIKRAARVDTRINAQLIDSDGNHIDVVVLDLSREGCRLQSAADLAIGERIELDVPKQGKVRAQIRWALGNEAGAVFLDPVQLPPS